MNNNTFKYQDSEITFQLESGDVMVNLTEMAKPFGKQPSDFMRLAQTQKFIEALQKSVRGIPVVTVYQGGNPKLQGTWAHQKLALKFAAWLNPRFELWVYDRIEELLRDGYTKLNTISRRELALMILKSEEEKERLQQRIFLQDKQQ